MYYRDEYMLYPTQDSIAMNLQRHPKKCVHQWGFVFLNQNLMHELEDSVIKKFSFSPIEKESLDLKFVNFLKIQSIFHWEKASLGYRTSVTAAFVVPAAGRRWSKPLHDQTADLTYEMW